MLGHPPRAGKVTVVDLPGALTLTVRIESKQDTDDFGPFRALFHRIEKPNVQREMLSIIVRQAWALRRLIIERDGGHYAGPPIARVRICLKSVRCQQPGAHPSRKPLTPTLARNLQKSCSQSPIGNHENE